MLMQTTSLFRRAAALALTLVLAVSASLAGFAAYDMPIQTVSDTESVYLFNLDTGKPILDQNAGQSRYIASLTKMMTALLFLESGKDLNEEITIPTSLTQEFKDIQRQRRGQRHRQRCLRRQPARLCLHDEPESTGTGLHRHQLYLRARPV